MHKHAHKRGGRLTHTFSGIYIRTCSHSGGAYEKFSIWMQTCWIIMIFFLPLAVFLVSLLAGWLFFFVLPMWWMLSSSSWVFSVCGMPLLGISFLHRAVWQVLSAIKRRFTSVMNEIFAPHMAAHTNDSQIVSLFLSASASESVSALAHKNPFHVASYLWLPSPLSQNQTLCLSWSVRRRL